MARWITVKEEAVPFDYYWPGRTAHSCFSRAGEYYVKDELADFAVARGYATDGKAKDSKARSTKGKTERPKRRKTAADAAPADTGPDNRLDAADMAAADCAGDRNGVDQAAG